MKLAKINKVLTEMAVLFGEVDAEIEEVHDWWGDRTEKWQESERGIEQEDQITELEELTETVSDAFNDLLEHVEGMK